MKLTALEIKQQNFENSMFGYDKPEVEAFLNLMSNEWEHMAAENRALEKRIEELEEKLKHYERVEEALHETLQTAKESSEQKLTVARREAQTKIEKAEMEAESLVREARQQRQEIRQSIIRLLDRRKEIIGSITSYLEMARESVQQFSEDEASLFSLPGSESRRNISKDRKKRNNKPPEKTGNPDQPNSTAENQHSPPGTENVDQIIDELE